MTEILGETLRRQRDQLAFSREQLCVLAGLPVERIAAIEQGASPSTAEISKLAKALAVDPAALWRGEVSSARTTARFRAPSGVATLSSEDAALLAQGAEAGRIAAHLSQLLERPPSAVSAARQVRPIDAWPEPWDQGYTLGAVARRTLWPERRPIQSMTALLERCGVHVAFVSFATTSLLAASLYEPGSIPVILLNSQATRVKACLSRRAVLAHELCHLLHDGGENDLLTLVSKTNDSSPSEQRANGFAPSFLVPAGWFEPHTTDDRRLVVDFATEWGLSFEGAVWHLKNSRKIAVASAENLVATKEVISEGSFEPPIQHGSTASLDIDAPAPLVAGLLGDLVLAAYDEDLISRGRAREILRLA